MSLRRFPARSKRGVITESNQESPAGRTRSVSAEEIYELGGQDVWWTLVKLCPAQQPSGLSLPFHYRVQVFRTLINYPWSPFHLVGVAYATSQHLTTNKTALKDANQRRLGRHSNIIPLCLTKEQKNKKTNSRRRQCLDMLNDIIFCSPFNENQLT